MAVAVHAVRHQLRVVLLYARHAQVDAQPARPPGRHHLLAGARRHLVHVVDVQGHVHVPLRVIGHREILGHVGHRADLAKVQHRRAAHL
eukprot:6464293-Pyramimonas_sp.AAC.1